MKKLGLLPRIIIAIAMGILIGNVGTACNVTGDGALAVIIDKLHKNNNVKP